MARVVLMVIDAPFIFSVGVAKPNHRARAQSRAGSRSQLVRLWLIPTHSYGGQRYKAAQRILWIMLRAFGGAVMLPMYVAWVDIKNQSAVETPTPGYILTVKE
jgi:hypothetical protein